MHKNLESKLNKFRQLIFEDLESQLNAEREQFKKESEALLNEKKELNHKHAEQFYKMRINVADTQVNKSLSISKMAVKNAGLELRENIFAETMQTLEQKALDFRGSEEYYKYIHNEIGSIRKELKQKSIRVFHLLEDKERLTEIFDDLETAAIEWKALNETYIGGIIVEISEQKVRYNITLKNAITEKSDYIGGVLYELLEGMAD